MSPCCKKKEEKKDLDLLEGWGGDLSEMTPLGLAQRQPGFCSHLCKGFLQANHSHITLAQNPVLAGFISASLSNITERVLASKGAEFFIAKHGYYSSVL